MTAPLLRTAASESAGSAGPTASAVFPIAAGGTLPRTAAASGSLPVADAVADGTPHRSRLLAAFAGLRPVLLGSYALAQAIATSWAALGHARAAPPPPGDHAWWHGAGPVPPETPGAGLFLALLTVAFYLTLPVLALLARGLRRRHARGRDARAGAALSFAAASTAAAAAVFLPVAALATALGPAGPAVWTAGVGDLPNVLRLCASVALVLAVVAGAPWGTPSGPGTPGRSVDPDGPPSLRR
ncbi:hypothetical protein [Streptomyces sp. NPDC088915]|uniref:hypothetical protein n=1 Tax=Streptomyces sp. NPDC088915 TaxID=3365912 RepID=UPI00380AD38A